MRIADHMFGVVENVRLEAALAGEVGQVKTLRAGAPVELDRTAFREPPLTPKPRAEPRPGPNLMIAASGNLTPC